MATSPDSQKQTQPNTYVVQNRRDHQEDLQRLVAQNRMLTDAMGGPFAVHPDPSQLRQVLDIGCGTGGWAIEAATRYPEVSLIGIDINQRMIDYAREQAEDAKVADRVEFVVMDALKPLQFPDASFDLVHMRLALSFMRTWDWPIVIKEMLRITRTGGTLQLTDTEILQQSNSPALTQLNTMSQCAFWRAGHLFEETSTGLTAHLPRLLKQFACQNVQSKIYALEYQAGTPQGAVFFEDMKSIFNLILPFLQKRGCAPADYATIYQQALEEMQRPDFHATWNIHTTWGNKR